MRSRVLVSLLTLVLLAPARGGAEPESFNRANLRFNQWFLENILEPAGHGYNFCIPKWGQRRVVDFMGNLEGPRDVISSLGQAKLRRAGIHAGRFAVNTTIGVAGFYDIAGRNFDWTASPETVGETLGVWGVPAGTYVILPVVGEFTVRGFVGWVADGFLNPIGWIPGGLPPVAPTAGVYVWRNVNLLATSMPSPRAPAGEWDAYEQARFEFHPYEVGRDLYFRDEAERIAD
jgi:phospholipid-binding lipoprotein MlaA